MGKGGYMAKWNYRKVMEAWTTEEKVREYQVYAGSLYEGGENIALFSTEDEAIACCVKHNKPIKTLICCCCGSATKGRQWHNRDTGYGLCDPCADLIKEKETPEEFKSNYGIEGIHFKVTV